MIEPNPSPKSKLWLNVLLIIIICVCVAPLAAVAWSSWFADKHGCTLHEGYANPCIVNGHDYADVLYSAFVSGWFMLITIPIGGAALLLLVGLMIKSVWKAFRLRIR